MSKLQYYRCQACLEVYSSPERFNANEALCVCDGNLDWLGEAGPDESKLSKTTFKSVCDGRCTSAVGPICDCECHGENHGTGRVAAITRIKGKVPILAPNGSNGVNIQACYDRADQFNALRQAVKLALEVKLTPELVDKCENKEYVNDYQAWRLWRDTKQEVQATKYNKLHKVRIDKLVKILNRLGGSIPEYEPRIYEPSSFDWRPIELMPEDYYQLSTV